MWPDNRGFHPLTKNLQLFQRRSEERFQREVLCHLNAAYNLARWLVGDANDAEDAVQEASVKALRAFSTIRGSDSRAWFLAIVRNTCMNLIRARNRRSDIETTDEEILMSAPEQSPRPDELVEKSYDAERLRVAIEALPPAWREMIILREFEQMNYRELAEVSGVPIGTVMSRLSRARDRLYELLREEAR